MKISLVSNGFHVNYEKAFANSIGVMLISWGRTPIGKLA